MFQQGIEENVELCTTLGEEAEKIREPTARRTKEATIPADRLHR
jgi:hypothetical protein